MFAINDVFKHGMSTIRGKDFNICVIDFLIFCPNVSNEIKQKNRDFRDELLKRFSVDGLNHPIEQHQQSKWTIEILFNEIIDDVVAFNNIFKSSPESHAMVFVCLDNGLEPYQGARLERSYIGSVFFQLDYEKIFNYLQGKNSKNIVADKLMNSYPLLLHANSISSGLLFNYYYSYLNKQISSTNNIFLIFTFEKDVQRESLPSKISVVLNTLIENLFLEKSPSTISSNDVVPIQSNVLLFTFDPIHYKSFDGKQTIVTFSLVGVADFGSSVEKICIWQDKLDLNVLSKVQLKDDVRGWNEEYQPCLSIDRENGQTINTFEKPDDSTKKCYFLPIHDAPITNDGHIGISTMKKTTKDCYDSYTSDPANYFTKDNRRISKTLVVPVYYIIMPSSCQFGPPDTNKWGEFNEVPRKGIIIDPDAPDRIQLAYVYGDVLRSHPMKQYNRYLRRTFYYVDVTDGTNEIIRYLFCAEYPYILSVLDQLEKSGQIKKDQKHDEYLRFCNMLNRLIQFNKLSPLIKLIQFNDQPMLFNNDDASENVDYADFRPLWDQIKEDIDLWYQIPDNDIYSPSIETMILPFEQTPHVLLFFTDKAREDPSIMTLIRNLQEQLQTNGYIVEDAETNLDLIETQKQIIFICTGNKNDKINHSIINAVQYKMNKYGVLRDVFILVNDAIRQFPCSFILSVPYLTFDLSLRSPHLNLGEITEIIHYLNNMNVLSTSYTDVFQHIDHLFNKSPLQCTSVGAGCAAAFYYNYAKLLTPLSDHQFRVDLIENQLQKDNLIDLNDNKSIFIRKWVFVIPWTIKDTNQLLSSALSLNESEQQTIGFKLSIWKSEDPTFINYKLTVTVGGVYQRSYSPLIVYKLMNLTNQKILYFPMEIPAALHGLQNQYENILSHFNFGSFDPFEQASVFRKEVDKFLAADKDATCRENIILVPLDKPDTPGDMNSITNVEQVTVLLQTLWRKLNVIQ